MEPGKKSPWQELLQSVRSDDGLTTRDTGEWTANKLYFWHQYIGITTKAMVGKPVWKGGVVYVDLFAGPGVCTLRDSRERIPGSPLIAAYAPRPFTKILLAEKGAKTAAACRERMDRTPAAGAYRMFEGDCNARIRGVAAAIPDKALTIAVVDPPGLDIDFESIEVLAQRGRVDLLVLFADGMDAVRNLEIYKAEGSRLDRFLGPDSGWREKLQGHVDSSKLREILGGIYVSQLKRLLGYQQFGHKTIRGPRGPLYRLVYASKHKRGLDFWNKVTAKDRSGQRDLF